jgi:hypothetical protein
LSRGKCRRGRFTAEDAEYTENAENTERNGMELERKSPNMAEEVSNPPTPCHSCPEQESRNYKSLSLDGRG